MNSNSASRVLPLAIGLVLVIQCHIFLYLVDCSLILVFCVQSIFAILAATSSLMIDETKDHLRLAGCLISTVPSRSLDV
jgi:hypothetical protein